MGNDVVVVVAAALAFDDGARISFEDCIIRILWLVGDGRAASTGASATTGGVGVFLDNNCSPAAAASASLD